MANFPKGSGLAVRKAKIEILNARNRKMRQLQNAGPAVRKPNPTHKGPFFPRPSSPFRVTKKKKK